MKRAVVDAKPFRINLSTLIVGCSTFIDDHDSVTLQPLSVVVLGLKCSENYAEKSSVSLERSPLWEGWTIHTTTLPFTTALPDVEKWIITFSYYALPVYVYFLGVVHTSRRRHRPPLYYLTLPAFTLPLWFTSCHFLPFTFAFLSLICGAFILLIPASSTSLSSTHSHVDLHF